MTLIVAVANADQIIQVSDRRLTCNTRLVDEAANKAGHAICDDASFLYSFTGLAKAANHLTSRWLPEALHDAARKGHCFHEIAVAFAEEATQYFQATPGIRGLPAVSQRLTVMFTGYRSDGHIVSALISNFQDFTNFINYPAANRVFSSYVESSIVPAAENPTVIQVVGQFGAFTRGDESQLRLMLAQRAPAEGIRQKAIAIVQDLSDRPASSGTVGKRLSTARLNRVAPLAPVVGYSSDVVENGMPLIDQVNLCTDAPQFVIADCKINAPSLVVFPRVHRNAPCPCGSSKKYKHCHRY